MSAKVNINRRYKTPKAVLRATLRLFEESPSNWTRETHCRPRKTANGGFALCASAAIDNFSASVGADSRARRLLYAALPDELGIVEANDIRGLKVILAALKKAVA